jgi:hypothetical protein
METLPWDTFLYGLTIHCQDTIFTNCGVVSTCPLRLLLVPWSQEGFLLSPLQTWGWLQEEGPGGLEALYDSG